ncbi:MAG: hypothetical protein H6912_06055 [Kordiimonadaceae bacterium]|nr:hypothetical protein [Kordiimonadaceae bacterium]
MIRSAVTPETFPGLHELFKSCPGAFTCIVRLDRIIYDIPAAEDNPVHNLMGKIDGI